MIRVQAFIVSKAGDTYKVEARAEGSDEPRLFDIVAKSEDEAAMTAIRRMEDLYGMLKNAVRLN